MDLSFEEHETIWNEEYKLKRYITSKYSMNEVHSYLWYEQAMLNKLEISKENVRLAENKENRILRDEIILSLLPIIKNNLKNVNATRLVEIGSVILNGKDTRHITAVACVDFEDAESAYYEIKTIVTNLVQTFKRTSIEMKEYQGFDYYDENYSKDFYVNNQKLGSLVVLKPKYTSYVGKKKFIVGFELDLESYMSIPKEQINMLGTSKYPSVELDYTIADANKNKYEVLNNILSTYEHEFIQSHQLIDIYENEEMKKYTIRYIVGSMDHTLDGKELNEFQQKFISYIKSKGLDILV